MLNIVFNSGSCFKTFNDDQLLLPLGQGHLTPRRVEVVQAVLKCQDNHAIASELGIAWRTVGNHFTKIRNEIGFGDKASLIVQTFDRYREHISIEDVDIDAVAQLISGLKPLYRETAFSYRQHGNYKAVAEASAVTPMAVKNKLFRINSKIREADLISDGVDQKMGQLVLLALLNLVPEECFNPSAAQPKTTNYPSLV